MNLGHDTVCAIATTVDLVNTAPGSGPGEALSVLDDLAAFVARRQISPAAPLTQDDLDEVRRLRGRLRAVFHAPDDAVAARLVNDILAASRINPRLTEHDGWPLHMHYSAPEATLPERLSAACGVALATLLAAGHRQRLATCAAPGCDHVLVDLSRNRSRRYCDSRTCGNRLHVAAYRARHRAT